MADIQSGDLIAALDEASLSRYHQPIQSGRMTERSWEVLLADPAGEVRVELTQTHTEPVYSNCAATVALPRPAFTVRSVSRTR